MTQPGGHTRYHSCLQRILAISLMLLISLGLFTPLLAVFSQSQLPSCCLRDGKHRCLILNSMRKAHSSAAAWSADLKCPNFPRSKATPAPTLPLSLAPARFFSSPLLAALEPVAQTEALHRVSSVRTRQKRGPPSCNS